MNPVRLIGIGLLVLGLLGLAWGSFSFTEQTHKTQIGPLALSVSEEHTVNVPVWAGAAAVVVGLVLLVTGGRKP